ncbi:oxidoreductase [Parasphingorhabdus pacifica]
MATWNQADIPDQTGRTVLITGANSGLGLHSARVLASKGARVLLGCRDAERGSAALEQVSGVASGAAPELVRLDLGDLASVRRAAAEVRTNTDDSLDVLMNNAGVMATPHHTTADGFELQFGTNHLGHAALTWLLMPALRANPGARVVTLSSLAHLRGHLDLDDLGFERRRYSPVASYAQAKLANLLFARELDRRARANGLDLISTGAHPGMSYTELGSNTVRSRAMPAAVRTAATVVARSVTRLTGQSVSQGALPQLYAATASDVVGGEYYGPDGFREVRGGPGKAEPSSRARDEQSARDLWEATEKLTGITADPA